MSDELLGIGEFARRSTLSVSALRFYDRHRVVVPVEVNPRTGYRRYDPAQLETARLVADLRRIGMGLGDLRMLIDSRGDEEAVSMVLDAHLRRLTAGLRDARCEIGRLRQALAAPCTTESRAADPSVVGVLAVGAADFQRAVATVRSALPGSTDPEVDVVVFEMSGETLTLYATDRYRLSACTISARGQSGRTPVTWGVTPARLAHIEAVLPGGDPLQLTVRTTELTATTAHEVVTVPVFQGGLPAVRHLVDSHEVGGIGLIADAAALASQLRTDAFSTSAEEDANVRVVFLAEDRLNQGRAVLADPDGALLEDAVPFNGQYLLDAVTSGPAGPLSLSLSRRHPLAIRFGVDSGTTSVLMPRRG